MNTECRDQSGAAPKASSDLNGWALTRAHWLIPIQLERLARASLQSPIQLESHWCAIIIVANAQHARLFVALSTDDKIK